MVWIPSTHYSEVDILAVQNLNIYNVVHCMQKGDIDPALIPTPGVLFRDQNEAKEIDRVYDKDGFGVRFENTKTYSNT